MADLAVTPGKNRLEESLFRVFSLDADVWLAANFLAEKFKFLLQNSNLFHGMKLKRRPGFRDKTVYAQGHGAEPAPRAANSQDLFLHLHNQVYHFFQVGLRFSWQSNHKIEFQVLNTFHCKNFSCCQYVILRYAFVDDQAQAFGASVRCNGGSSSEELIISARKEEKDRAHDCPER
jgi:hypothetical protein